LRSPLYHPHQQIARREHSAAVEAAAYGNFGTAELLERDAKLHEMQDGIETDYLLHPRLAPRGPAFIGMPPGAPPPSVLPSQAPESSSAPATALIRLVTCNVLSWKGCTKDEFPAVSDVARDPAQRMHLLKGWLASEVAKDAILCLQQVGRMQLELIQKFLGDRQYHVHSVESDGSEIDDYASLVMAFPTSRYEALHMWKPRISETHNWGNRVDWDGAVPSGAMALSPHQEWAMLKRAPETCLMMTFKDAITGYKFAVGTSRLMRLSMSQGRLFQAALFKAGMRDFANGLPFMMCGDFGANPLEPSREIIENEMKGCLELPAPSGFTAPSCDLCLRDAFASVYQHPAPITTSSLNRQQMDAGYTAITASMDAIYVVSDVRVVEADPLPTVPEQEMKEKGGLIPSSEWFSDHYPVAAMLELFNI